jgi:hypothetical protein
MLDLLAFTGLDWLYDHIEDRYGRGAAWIVTFAVGLSILGILVWVLVLVVNRQRQLSTQTCRQPSTHSCHWPFPIADVAKHKLAAMNDWSAMTNWISPFRVRQATTSCRLERVSARRLGRLSDDLDFDDATLSKQSRRSHRSPCGMWAMHEFVFDLFERLELLIAGSRKIGPVPDVEAVDHHDIVEPRSSGGQRIADTFEGPANFILERIHIGSFAGAPSDDHTR